MAKKIYACDGADASIITCEIEFSDGRVATNYQDALDMMVESFDSFVQDKYYEALILIPAAEWDIEHNLGKNPTVFLEDSEGEDIEGEIIYEDDNNLKVIFSEPVAGKIYLN